MTKTAAVRYFPRELWSLVSRERCHCSSQIVCVSEHDAACGGVRGGGGGQSQPLGAKDRGRDSLSS